MSNVIGSSDIKRLNVTPD